MSATPLPPCPSCSAMLLPDRVMEQGRSTNWFATISCGACLSIAQLEWGDPRGAPSLSVRAPGTVVARTRDALRGARERGDAEAEVRRLLADPERGWLLSAPEIQEEALPALGKSWRLSRSATLSSPWYQSAAGMPQPIWSLSPGHPLLRKEDLAGAVKGSELGGFVFLPYGGRVVILAAQRLTLVALHGKHRVFEIPTFARRHLAGVTCFVDPEGLVLPDRVRRPV